MAKPDRRVKRAVNVSVNRIINAIADEIIEAYNKDLAQGIRDWGSASNRNIQQKEGLKAVHSLVAEEARRATFQAYTNSGLGKSESYRWRDQRKWKRYSNGKMEEAILDNKTISFDGNGIYLFDKSNMDDFAKQWYRLNFGTKSGRDKNVNPIELFDVPLRESPTLASFPLSPEFTMPSGIWSSTFSATTMKTDFDPPTEGGKNAFYAIGKRNPRPKSGNGKVVRGRKARDVNQIVGRSFLDEGVEKMNIRYGKLLEPLIVSWISEFRRK